MALGVPVSVQGLSGCPPLSAADITQTSITGN